MELEQALKDSWQTLSMLQTQISRGEETYFDETVTQGNIYKGWESFLDARLSTEEVNKVVRMPADCKWFSALSSSERGIMRVVPHVDPNQVTPDSVYVPLQKRRSSG